MGVAVNRVLLFYFMPSARCVSIHCNVYRTVYLKLSASMFDLRWEKKLIKANDVRDEFDQELSHCSRDCSLIHHKTFILKTIGTSRLPSNVYRELTEFGHG